MKMMIAIMMLFLAANSVWAQPTVRTRATFVVRDDRGLPVPKALIEGGFRDVTDAGSRDRFKKLTDTNGMLVVKGRAMIGVGGLVTADGHYQTITSVPLEYDQLMTLRRWDVEVPVLLKRIRNPIPMFVKGVSCDKIRDTSNDKKGHVVLSSLVGYDMLEGAMVAPYGKGKVMDLEFNWKWTVITTYDGVWPRDSDMLSEVRLTNGVDGICRGIPDGSADGQIGSWFRSAYEAPESGYTNLISYYCRNRGTERDTNDDRHDLYYFRIRTQTNELGQVTNALYGKIEGQINERFAYFLNPTPNDRNVESDPKRNLCEDPEAW